MPRRHFFSHYCAAYLPVRRFLCGTVLLCGSALFGSGALFGSAAWLGSAAWAQDADEGWQDLDSLLSDSPLPASAPSASTSSDSAPSANPSLWPEEGWIDLEELTSPELPSQGGQPSSVLSTEDWLEIDAQIATASSTVSAIEVGDLVDIKVANVESLSAAYRVSTLGTLVLPLVGSVTAVGRSAAELEAELETLYGADYLVNPKITVTPRAKIIGHVHMAGLINRSGPIAMTSALSLAEVINQAGGVNGEPSDLDAIILRKIGNTIRARRVPLEKISLADLPGPFIFPEDRINILQQKKLADIKNERGQYPLLDKVLSGGSLVNY